MIIVVVGFKVTEANSTFYRKFEVNWDSTNPMFEEYDGGKLGKVMAQALKVSDFVSVRKVEE